MFFFRSYRRSGIYRNAEPICKAETKDSVLEASLAGNNECITEEARASVFDVSPADFSAALVLCDRQLNWILAASLAVKADGEPIAASARVHGPNRSGVDLHLTRRHRRFNDRRSVLGAIEDRDASMVEIGTAAPRAMELGDPATVWPRLDLIALHPSVRHD